MKKKDLRKEVIQVDEKTGEKKKVMVCPVDPAEAALCDSCQ